MPDAVRAEAKAAAQRLLVSMHSVVDTFSEELTRIDLLNQVLEGPSRLSETLAGVDFQAERSRLTAVLDDFEAARREARLAAWRLMAVEGTSIGEMGRIFGLSRQLISRHLRRTGGEAATPASTPAS